MSMLLRLFILVLTASLLPAQQARAQNSPTLSDWQTRLSRLSCGEQSPASFDLDAVISISAAFARRNVESMAAAANFSLTEYILNGNRISQAEQGKDYTERLLAANPDSSNAFRTAIRTHQQALCPVLEYIAGKGLNQIVDTQVNVRAYYQPQSELAQFLLNVRGCEAGTVDGLFGPGSRAAWNSAASNSSQIRSLRDGELPMPGDIVALAHAPANPALCNSRIGNLTPLLSTLSACNSETAPLPDTTTLGKTLADLTNPDRRWGGDGLAKILTPFWQTCEVRMQSDQDAFLRNTPFAGEALLLAFIDAHDPVPVTTDELDSTARALTKAISDPEVANWENPRGTANILRDVGAALLRGHGVRPQPEFGLWLIAVSSDPDDFLRGPPITLAKAYIDGSLPIDVSPSVNFALRRLFFPIFAPNADAGYADIGESTSAFAEAESETRPWWLPEGRALPTVATIGLAFNTPLHAIHATVSQAQRAATDPNWAQHIRQNGSSAQNAKIATLLIEGFAKDGKQVELALQHFEAAASKGNSYAMLRLAQMYEQGYGVARDASKASEYYRMAADAGQPAALLALAEAYETGQGVSQDWNKALDLYKQGLGLTQQPASPIGGVEIAIGRRLMAGSQFFSEGPGLDLLDDLLTASANPVDEYGPWFSDVGLAMGDLFAGLRQSHSVDLERAANWYRASASHQASQRLRRLLWARPELAKSSKEIRDLSEGSLLAHWLDDPDPQNFRAALKRHCKFNDSAYVDCAEFLRQAAIGSYDTALISPAYNWLVHEAAAASKYKAQVAADPHSEEAYVLAGNKESLPANAALVDVLAFYGDYEGARAALLPLSFLDTSDETTASAAREVALRKSLRRYLENGDEEAWRPIARLLRSLAERGDNSAREFLSLAAGAADALQDVTTDLATARSRFEAAETRGAGMPSFSFSARRLSHLEGAAGNTDRAIELELIAMESDFGQHSTAEVWLGSVPSTLARICTLSRSSERLFQLNQRPLALALAKQAVNELQGLRADLIELPEKLQLCFREHMSNHYRWLADLFIQQDRPAEAAAVLNMLKSFETFEFVGRDTDFGQAGFSALALIPEERELIKAASLVATATSIGSQPRHEQTIQQPSRKDADDEASGPADTPSVTAIAQPEINRDTALERLKLAAAQVEARDTAASVDPSLSIRRQLRTAAYGKDAMMLQYLVLPDRLGIVLTTKDDQTTFSLDQLPNGQPFSETALNAKINTFRDSLSHQDGDPDPLGAQLFEILFPPNLKEAIQKAAGDTLVLSLDGQLRYLPFAALRDDGSYLVEQFTLTHATETQTTKPVSSDIGRIAAFGATREWADLGALPGVAIELARLVISEEGDNGVVPGDTYVDDDFTRASFTRALSSQNRGKTGLNIVHLASHFVLGPTQDQSFLLMGDGKKLSVSEIRRGLDIGLDFKGVGLLTLSACNTAYGGHDNDGRELESFAAVAQQKGAAAVVATLWQVGDITNALLMERMYDQLINRQATPAQALAAAQRAFLHGGDILQDDTNPGEQYPGASHPFYWAPIVVMEGAA